MLRRGKLRLLGMGMICAAAFGAPALAAVQLGGTTSENSSYAFVSATEAATNGLLSPETCTDPACEIDYASAVVVPDVSAPAPRPGEGLPYVWGALAVVALAIRYRGLII
jgi:hypothetical protein